MNRILITTFFLPMLLLVQVDHVFASGQHSPWAEDAIRLMNEERASYGVPSLVASERLFVAAAAKLSDMEKKNYFAHTSPEKRTPWSFIEDAGYDYRFAGENLAIHFKDPESEHAAWMKSEKHCQNILDPRFREVGMAVNKTFFEGRETMLTVVMFGTKDGEPIDPLAKKEQALALCRGESPVVFGSESEVVSDSAPEDRAALLANWISGKSGTIAMMRGLIDGSPYEMAALFAVAMFSGAQLSAIVLLFGIMLFRERRDGVFPS